MLTKILIENNHSKKLFTCFVLSEYSTGAEWIEAFVFQHHGQRLFMQLCTVCRHVSSRDVQYAGNIFEPCLHVDILPSRGSYCLI